MQLLCSISVTSPAEAVPFASTSLVIDFAPGDTAVISSKPDGTGAVVIDNFVTINGTNLCEAEDGKAREQKESCFDAFIRDPADPSVVGLPIAAVLTPIGKIYSSRRDDGAI